MVNCQAGDPRRSWADIGKAIELPRETAWRQFTVGAPLVMVNPWQPANSPLSGSQPQPFTADSAIYAFRDQDGNWFGSADALEEDRYRTGWLSFNPPNAPANLFGRQEFLVRHGPWDGDVTFVAPEIIEKGTGRLVRIRATYEVVDWLLGDGQTALRQAMTQVAHAVAITPNTDPALAEPVDEATRARNPDLPIEGFVAAAAEVAGHAASGYRDSARLDMALTELERAVRQRQVRDERAR